MVVFLSQDAPNAFSRKEVPAKLPVFERMIAMGARDAVASLGLRDPFPYRLLGVLAQADPTVNIQAALDRLETANDAFSAALLARRAAVLGLGQPARARSRPIPVGPCLLLALHLMKSHHQEACALHELAVTEIARQGGAARLDTDLRTLLEVVAEVARLPPPRRIATANFYLPAEDETVH
jgi:hypothetical protein